MKTYQKIYYMHTVLFFVRTYVNIKMFPDHHTHHSEVCRERTTQIIEFDASKVIVEIDQYVDDVSFDGAYVFLQGSYKSGKLCTAQLNEMCCGKFSLCFSFSHLLVAVYFFFLLFALRYFVNYAPSLRAVSKFSYIVRFLQPPTQLILGIW